MTLKIGDPAPDFTLPDATGQPISLGQFRGKRLVIYFYPRDNTPGCTKEACSFRDRYADYQAAGIQVLGVSKDDARSHTKFIEKYQLPFPLLVDEDAAVAKAYGVYGPKTFMGKTYDGITRSTFVIDPEGKIESVYGVGSKSADFKPLKIKPLKIKVETHAQDVLQDILTASGLEPKL
jgi:peroxiredoxin Q/BCP